MRVLGRFSVGGLSFLLLLNSSTWGQILTTPSNKPKSREASFSKAVALYQENERRQACALFEQLKTDPPSNPVLQLYLLGCAIRQPRGPAVDAQQSIFDSLDSPASGLNGIAGDWLAASGHCVEAKNEYARAPTGNAAGAIEYGLGQCYQQTGDRVSALVQYRRALELDPSKEEHYLSPASLLIIGGQFEEAQKILAAGKERFPDSLRLVIAMSLLRLDIGYPDEARIEYEKARSMAPDSPAVWKLLGMIQRTEGDFPSAVKSFEHAAALDGKDAQTYLFMGLAQERVEGGADAALVDLQHAAQIAPGLVEAQFETASIYLIRKGDSQRAIAMLSKVIAIAPDYAPAYRVLAQAYSRVGSLDKADRAARKYRQLTHSGESPPSP
jgi:tetratricopeptide (TPR) repeat protein